MWIVYMIWATMCERLTGASSRNLGRGRTFDQGVKIKEASETDRNTERQAHCCGEGEHGRHRSSGVTDHGVHLARGSSA